MSDLSANLPQIISAAAQSHLGILALLSIALSVLAYFFFSAASEKVKVGIFGMLFLGVMGFGFAMFRTPQAAATAATAGVGGGSNAPADAPALSAQVLTSPPAAGITRAEAFVGRWAGQARDEQGQVFDVEVRIDKPCVAQRPCGSIRVSHVPCQGELSLVQTVDGDNEFSVDHFTKDSAPVCSKGAGEHFKLQADGSLLYTTTYEPKARGILTKRTS